MMLLKPQLDSFTVSGWRALPALENIHLTRLTILRTPALFQYFELMGALVEGRLQRWTRAQGGAQTVIAPDAPALYSALTFGQYGYEFTLAPTQAGGLAFLHEHLFWVGADTRLTLGAGHAESALKDQRRAARGMIANIVLGAITGWGLFHFRDMSQSAWIRRAWAVTDSARLRPNGENLAAVLVAIQQGNPDRYLEIRTILQRELSFFDDFVLVPEPASKQGEQIRLGWRAMGNPTTQTPDALSDETLRLMGWVTALMQPQPPPTLILELPEMTPLLSELIHAASHQSRVIITNASS